MATPKAALTLVAPPRRRAASKPKKAKKSKARKGMPGWVRTGAETLVGTLLGGILAPVLPAWMSGPALGIVTVGVASRGFRSAVMPHVAIAGAFQGAHLVARTATYTAIQQGVAAGLVSVGMTPTSITPGFVPVGLPATSGAGGGGGGGGDAITRVSDALADAARVAGAVSDVSAAFA
jgi:hypothetical protein